ncbi:hypothetical protein BH23BAC2_BH23BAC2_26490 [soil metagenome]
MDNRKEDHEEENTKKAEGYTPEEAGLDKQNETNDPVKNLKWDQAQRRQQAGPRSYNKSLDKENIENQNTLADQEQTNRPDGAEPKDQDNKKDQGNHLVGDKATERQQTRDDENEERNSDISKDRWVD